MRATEGTPNRHMLKLGRELRGFSQSALSSELGVTQSLISKIESGAIGFTNDVVVDLASKLKIPPDFFYQSEFEPRGAMIFNRAMSSVGVKIWAKHRAQCDFARIQVAHLLKSAEAESPARYSIPDFDIDQFREPPDILAQRVRGQWGLPVGPVDNIVDLIERGNGIVVSFPFVTSKIDAELHLHDHVPPMFFVNSTAPADRLRTTLAHELGHAVMHSHSYNPDMEDQANKFAAEFLMPARDIKREFGPRLTLERLAEMKLRWKVSMATLLMRAAHLGVISSHQSTYLWRKMATSGYRLREPSALDFPREQPTKFKKLVEVHLQELEYSEEDLASLLLTDVSSLRALYGAPTAQPSALRRVK